ncbi:LacI family DNA-binding transcriptional regulator [Acidisoma cellulosilytica]|uniref:LacI family DNA-binding transcriptional regulator n=1 Tax=Acidisoma cellulosilyticum TaxID=2802395 RepID=A0A963Z2I3_9PROT|nr:LacI family DNA-binding transcriptional regulator [Acidisoma cellulosilyticum]MCB8881321.1 LacI family DNA-binding transcriptional regulator [Acidisoma cellulosilyticum]
MTDIPDIRTMEDFATYVGLSRPTVSKYFNDPRSVRSVTRDKIEAAIETSNFRPNLFAANLKRSRTRVLGIIIPNSTDPFYMALTERIEAIAEAAGYFAFMLSSNGRIDLEAEAIDRLQSMNVAGAIVIPVGARDINARLTSLAKKIPLVYVDNPPDDDLPFVGTNNDQSFGVMVDYLCRSGEPPCYLGMPEINRNASSRRRAYMRAMERFGETPKILPIPDSQSWDFERFGHELTAQFLTSGLPTRTLLCANDRIALGAQLAAWEAGLKVGHGADCTLRIAGHDDHPLSRFACPPLTTMAQNVKEIGSLAMSQLMSRLSENSVEAGPAGERVLLRGDLKLRASA